LLYVGHGSTPSAALLEGPRPGWAARQSVRHHHRRTAAPRHRLWRV